MAGLFEAGYGKIGILEIRIMPLQDMPHILQYTVEFKGKEQGFRFEVTDLKNKKYTACQTCSNVFQPPEIKKTCEVITQQP